MRKLSLLFIILCFVLGCASSNETFKNFNRSFYNVYPIEIDHSPKKDSCVLYGTMFDAHSKEFLIMATIKAVSDTIYEARSDNKGNYKLIIPEGSYSLLFSYVGYYSVITNDIKSYKYHTQRIDAFLNSSNLE